MTILKAVGGPRQAERGTNHPAGPRKVELVLSSELAELLWDLRRALVELREELRTVSKSGRHPADLLKVTEQDPHIANGDHQLVVDTTDPDRV